MPHLPFLRCFSVEIGMQCHTSSLLIVFCFRRDRDDRPREERLREDRPRDEGIWRSAARDPPRDPDRDR